MRCTPQSVAAHTLYENADPYTLVESGGVLDTTFGPSGTGIAVTDFGNHSLGYDVAIQSDGKIVVGGYHLTGVNEDFALVRYTSGGLLDTTFGPAATGWTISPAEQ